MKNSDDNVVYRPLKRRFYILFAFCIYSFTGGIIWNSWQPLLKSVNELYCWSNAEVNLLNNINAIVFCVLIVPFVFLWNNFGIKKVYTTSSCIVLLGCLVRVFPCPYNVQAILVQVGNTISAYGNLMSYVGSTAISAIWFPTSERSRSTCTALAFSTLGSVIAPIAASQIVPTFEGNQSKTAESKMKIETGMQQFMFLHCSIALFGLMLIILYFPLKPKYMPCKSSERCLRIDLKTGTLMLAKNKQFWLIFVLNFITSGINSGVISVLPSIIEPLNVTQKETGFLIAVGNFCVFFGSLIGGYLGDKFSYKKIVLIATPPSVITYVLFGLQGLKIIRHELGAIYVVLVVTLLVSNVTSNISFEMGCEVSFPASEEITTAMLGFATNLGIVVFLSVSMITNSNVTWIPFAYAAAVALTFPMMFFYNDERKRFHCDYGTPETTFIQIVDEEMEENLPENEMDDCSLLRIPN